MTLRASNQVLCNVWSYDFYEMTLATEEQRRHMINAVTKHIYIYFFFFFLSPLVFFLVIQTV